MDHSAIDFLSKSANRKVRKLLARAYLRERRISEALDVYQGLLAEIPDDPDVLLILVNLYHLAGCSRAAKLLNERMAASDGSSRLFQQPVLQAGPDLGRDGKDDASDPLSPEAITRLAEQLLAINDPERAEQIRASADPASDPLEAANSDEWGGSGSASEEVQTLMPALIELNIRQARAAGFPDLAEALQSLRLSLSHSIEDRWVDDLLKDENTLNIRD